MSSMKFTLRCEVPTRWVPHFLGILKRMQMLGSIGSSRHVTIYSDGDGDFRPRFEWDEDLPEPAKPHREHGGDTLFDAG
jgi:hypothetical protein